MNRIDIYKFSKLTKENINNPNAAIYLGDDEWSQAALYVLYKYFELSNYYKILNAFGISKFEVQIDGDVNWEKLGKILYNKYGNLNTVLQNE